MSFPFIKDFNQAEQDLQKDAEKQFHKFSPEQRTALQLDQIWRQLAFLNGLSQFTEARKTPGELNTYTIILNLFGQAQSGAMDQIIPANPRRKRVTLYASEGNAYISNDRLQSLVVPSDFTPGGTASPLLMQQYFFLPTTERWPLESNTALYGIGASTTTYCILSIVEELYNMPRNLHQAWLLSKKEEADKVEKASDWMETDQAAVARRESGIW